MGNVEFGVVDTNTEKPGPAADSKDALNLASRLLGIDVEKLVYALTMKKQQLGKDLIESPLTLDQAYQARDSLSKHLYGNIFSWIVQKINSSISVQTGQPIQEESKAARPAKKNIKKQAKLTFIGLLDIFGFEIFAKNSFE